MWLFFRNIVLQTRAMPHVHPTSSIYRDIKIKLIANNYNYLGNISGANQPLRANRVNFNLSHRINIQEVWGTE